MTLRTRNLVLSILLVMAVTFFVLFVIALFFVQSDAPVFKELATVAQGRYLGQFWPLPEQEVILTMVSSALSLLIACVSAFIILFNFRKVNSPELFFLAVFWFSMIFEAMRAFNLVALQQGWSIQTSITLARCFYFGRILGSISLLAASFHLAGSKLQHQNALWLAALVISAGVALYAPLDTSRYLQGYMFGTSQFFSIDLLSLLLGIMSLLNVGKFIVGNGLKGNALMFFGFLMLLTGHEFLGASITAWSTIVAWVLLAGSTVLLTRRFIRSYLWYY